MKNLKKLFLVSILVIAGFTFMPTEEAQASGGSGDCQKGSNWGFSNQTLCIYSQSNGDIIGKIYSNDYDKSTYYLTIKLQEKVGGSIKNHATRYDTITNSSFAYQKFYSMPRGNYKVYVKFYSDYARTKYLGAAQSPYFYH
ncbi:hypothetical protein LC087_06855 [Bacillus carboniphilus]|uniref:Secreted protein n=1 Tax=Bacillus carboniphilus TaxID=86663 RepID=A0ABY9K1W5_9BACI|nr:hypothetical protein [Bacillus carboniphilus]WLR43835.1 hypothetical protein LC087_06855 [Bacillus carboniphilus]